MKKIIFSIIVLLFIIPFTLSIHGETEKIILSVPQKMIVGENYEGMITLLEPSINDGLGTISSGNDFILETQKNFKIKTNENHGIFSISPLHEGETIISVLYDGKLLTHTTKVYSKTSDAQKLKIILPTNNTLATDIKGFVFLLDGNDSPISSTFDRIVSLISSEKITVPQNIVIKNGTSHAIFDVIVRSTGEITAIAPQLSPDTIPIQKTQEIIDVKLGIAPNIILEESYTNYFVWLEKDGKPYTIKDVLKVEIQSSNTDVVRLELSPNAHKNDNIISVSMYDGISKGRLYTGTSGISEISVSIPGYGHASSMVHVGTTLLGDNNKNYSSQEQYDDLEINNIQFWIYPGITNDYSYGVASLYHAEQTEEINISVDDDIQITSIVDQTILIPVKTEDTLISVSSQSGLSYDSSYTLDDVQFPTHSKVFEITAENVGDYTITATGGNSFDTAQLIVTTDHNSKYSINLTELPTLSHMTQPLLLVSVIDDDENLVDIEKIFGSLFTVDVYSTNAKVSSSVIFDDNVGIVSGLLGGSSEITVTSEFGTTSKIITPSGVATSIEVFTPGIIHSGESFPVVIHEVDSKGIPISKKDISQISSSGFDGFDVNMGVIIGEGLQNISILSQLGGGFQTQIESFVNQISFDVGIDNTEPRLGEPVIITINSPITGITYDIDSPFPYDKIDGTTFEVTPDYEISDATITIIGKLNGFGTTDRIVTLSSVNLVEIDVSAISINGDIITPTFDIQLTDGITTHDTPYKGVIPPQTVIVTIPDEWKSLDGGYKLDEIISNGETVNGKIVKFYADTDYSITILYDKFIKVTVNDGEGSGVYSYGESVKISAPDKPIIPILIKETFDYWIGSDITTSSFTITPENDYSITAVYKDDYSVLMVIVMGGVGIIVLIVVRKGESGLKYKIDEYIERLTPILKQLIPVKRV